MSWNMARIRSNVEGEFNRDEVVRAPMLLLRLQTLAWVLYLCRAAKPALVGKPHELSPNFFLIVTAWQK